MIVAVVVVIRTGVRVTTAAARTAVEAVATEIVVVTTAVTADV